jgi:hypothetical protein
MTPSRALTDIARLVNILHRGYRGLPAAGWPLPESVSAEYLNGLRRASILLRREAAFERGLPRKPKVASKGGKRAR